MNKIFLGIALSAVAVLTSCDPTQSEKDWSPSQVNSEQLADMISFQQFNKDDNTQTQENGNWIVFNTNPSQIVTIYNFKNDGTENVLSYGKPSGAFLLRPKRGSDPNQTVHLRYVNSDGSVTEAERQLTVEVASELNPEVKLLASNDYGQKIWKWDTEFRADHGVWGNLGYLPGDGESFATSGNGIWWGATPTVLGDADQLKNQGGTAHGYESPDAYMVLDDEGGIATYDKDGKEIAKGSYEVVGYDGERHPSADGSQAKWSLGTFKATKGSILMPYKINGAGEVMPEEFEIMQLDAGHLKLIYADPGTGAWSEATWWAFKSESDATGALTNNDKKAWTWDTEFRADGGVWGNLGYLAGDGDSFATSGNGIWWGATPTVLADADQLKNQGGTTHGYESPDAYMVFDGDQVTSYNASNAVIASGAFEIQNWNMGKRLPSSDNSQAKWSLGTLHTAPGAILMPYKINGEGKVMPEDFEIMQLDVNHLKLIYAAPGTGAWAEATWWAFKAKK